MIFGMTPLTFMHVVISLVGIGSGFVVVYGLLAAKRLDVWTAIFLATTVLTSITGFFFPFVRMTPAQAVGLLSLLVLAVAIVARYRFHLAGRWRQAYVISSVVALYFNVFVLVVQLFQKVPALHALAPTQSEAPFLLTQIVILALLVVFAVAAAIRFRIEPAGAPIVWTRSMSFTLFPHALSLKGKHMKLLTTNRTFASAMVLALIAVLIQPARQAGAAETKNVLLDPADTVILLLDHQNGLFQTVKDVPVAELRTNTVILAKLAKLAKVPVITTASEPNGPNGPLMHELKEVAPDAIYVPRKGEISAWDNEDFVKTVKNTGRKTLVIAGVWTSVCVAFPALQAKAEGYNVYFVTDASGDPSPMASQTTIARLTQAGIVPMSTNAVFCELQRTWNRPDAAQYAELYAAYAPNYQAVMESYKRAQEAAGQSKK